MYSYESVPGRRTQDRDNPIPERRPYDYRLAAGGLMRQINISEENFRKLIELKNHWSFQHRRVTNPKVVQILEELKLKIFGYNSSMSDAQIDEIACKKTKEQLQEEAERFSNVYRDLLVSGYDFEPEYTIDDHIKKMLEVIDQDGDISL
jgi:predicted CopG family antitoxin